MLRIKEEANRCLNCKKPMCVTGCPVSTPIPQAIQLFKEGKTTEAAQMLFENNPLSVICAIVCNHEGQCEGHCIRGKKSTPVAWSAIERYLSDTALERVKIPVAEPSGKNVAIIGSGPAGISAAIMLTQKGHNVTIFEAESLIGGMLQYGIPEFRLPKTILRRYAKKLKESGIRLRLHTASHRYLSEHCRSSERRIRGCHHCQRTLESQPSRHPGRESSERLLRHPLSGLPGLLRYRGQAGCHRYGKYCHRRGPHRSAPRRRVCDHV